MELEGERRADDIASDRPMDAMDAAVDDRDRARTGKRRPRRDDARDGRVSVLDRLGRTNGPRAGDRSSSGFKRSGGDSRMSRDARERERLGRRAPRAPRERRAPACETVKRDDGVVVARAFETDIVQVSPTGEVCLRRPLDDAGAPRCDAEVLNAFNSCLNKFGFNVSAAPTDQTRWSLSDGRRLSLFTDGVVVPAPNPPGPGRGLAMLLTAPVGNGDRGGRGFSRAGRGFRGRGGRGGFGGYW